jgi:predicted DNA-binding transcriptional regulator AlpA
MKRHSMREAAKKLKIDVSTLSKYVSSGKVPGPKPVDVGGARVFMWTEEDIEKVRKILPKLVNGRKTRYQKKAKQTGKKK